MKTIHFLSSWARMLVLLLIIGAVATTGCKKENGDRSGGGFGDAPRKEVPDPFVGKFTYVTQTGGYVDQYGSYIPGVAKGLTLTIDHNGTGSSIFRVETGSYGGSVTVDEIRCQCTYEITKTSETTANIIMHTVSGKNYRDGVFRNDIPPSQLYPNDDTEWDNAQIGTNSEGATIFTVGSEGNFAQFTKQ